MGSFRHAQRQPCRQYERLSEMHGRDRENGGCNYMRCENKSCRYEFCWMCMGPDDHMTHRCNSFKESATNAAREKSRASLDRFIFYYNRYIGHQQSLKLEKKNNQKDLEMATEELSGFLERDLNNENLKTLKQKVQDKYRYVEHHRKVLLNHCAEGVEQDFWVFSE